MALANVMNVYIFAMIIAQRSGYTNLRFFIIYFDYGMGFVTERYAASLKLTGIDGSGKGDHISDITDSREIHDGSFEAQTKTGVLDAPVPSKI